MPSATLTTAVAELAASVEPGSLPEGSADLVGGAVLDFLAAATAAVGEPEARAVAGWAAAAGGATGARLLAVPARAPAALAAFANGTVGHLLDYDDFSPDMLHPSVCLVPCLLALGEIRGLSGTDAVVAYVAGFEVATRIARVVNPGHYDLGWHSTGTVGTLAAAVAAGRMAGLSTGQLRHAVGIAASCAGGLRQNFGSTVKPMHAGFAAMHGTMAAELAAVGVTADEAALDGPAGYVEVFTGGAVRAEQVAAAFDADGFAVTEHGLSVKQYACCGGVHAAIQALLHLMSSHGLAPADVAEVECCTTPQMRGVLKHRVARTPLEGKFSIEYSLAVALLDGEAGPEQFTPARVADPAVQELSRRVRVSLDDFADTTAKSPAVVTLRTTDGRVLTERVDVPDGRDAWSPPWDRLAAKFDQCARRVLPEPTRREVVAACRGIGDLPSLGRLVDLVAPRPGGASPVDAGVNDQR